MDTAVIAAQVVVALGIFNVSLLMPALPLFRVVA